MLDFLLGRISKLAGTYSIILGVTTALLLYAYFHEYVIPQIGVKLLDSEIRGYDAALMKQRMAAFGSRGRTIYYTFISAPDQVFCLVYGIFLSAWLTRLFGWKGRHLIIQMVDLIPLLGGLSDYIENLYLFALTYTYPLLIADEYLWLVPIFSAISVTKWACFLTSVALITFGTLKSLLCGNPKDNSKDNAKAKSQ